MSEFQLGLLVIGATVVVAVLAFNKWQEIRYRRNSERSFKPDHPDLLLDPEVNVEIGLPDEDVEEAVPHVAIAESDRGRAGIVPVGRLAAKAASEGSCLSSAIDLITLIESPLGLSVDDLHASGLGEGLAGRIRLEGLTEGVWGTPLENRRYQSLQVGLQLASRRGAVSIRDLDSFAEWVGEIAERFGSRTAPLDLGAAYQAALSLDKFCGDVDIQIAVHVIAGDAPFPGTRIRAIAEAAGLAMEADGRFRRRDEDGREIFSLANEGETPFQVQIMRELSTSSLVLEFDVARCPGGNHSFTRFRQFAEHLASGLGGRVVDDNRASLDGTGFDAIAKELVAIDQAMVTRGILPGSPDSLRLFS